MRRYFTRKAVVASFVAALAGAGCGGSNYATTSPSTVAAGRPQPTQLEINGDIFLTAIGEEAQLTAVATWPDGTTRNVASEVRWTSNDTSVVTISPSGVARAVGLGRASVDASYGPLSKTLRIVVTPTGTFVVSGRVREPGHSGIPDVRVLELQSGKSVRSDQNGSYSLAALTSARLTFEKAGFEPGQLDATPNGSDDLALQRIIRIAAGETVTPSQLVPHDMSYIVGTDRCYPCRLIRVVTGASGALQLWLTWNEPHSTLNVWVDGRRFAGNNLQVVASVPVAAGEVVLYVGLPAFSSSFTTVPFTLTTLINQ